MYMIFIHDSCAEAHRVSLLFSRNDEMFLCTVDSKSVSAWPQGHVEIFVISFYKWLTLYNVVLTACGVFVNMSYYANRCIGLKLNQPGW